MHGSTTLVLLKANMKILVAMVNEKLITVSIILALEI